MASIKTNTSNLSETCLSLKLSVCLSVCLMACCEMLHVSVCLFVLSETFKKVRTTKNNFVPN